MKPKNYLEVYSYIQASFIFHVSFLYDFWHSLMFGLCCPFLDLLRIFFGLGEVQKLVWGLIINTRNSTVLSIFYSDFYFWSNLGVVRALLGQEGHFLGQSEVRKLFLGLFMHTSNFCFLSMVQLRRYHPISFFSTEGRTDGRRDGQTYL